MDITNKCCNQFGERDEIQAIIDKLRADVAERDELIKELKQDINELYDDRGWDFRYPDVGVSYEKL